MDNPNKASMTRGEEGASRPTGNESNLVLLQARIGNWALRQFGPTPMEVHAARLSGECVDVLDCAAIGDGDRLGSALAGVLVVALALANSHDIDLAAALQAEQDLNEKSTWAKTPWGQWERIGDGEVRVDELTRQIVRAVELGLAPATAALLMRERGASLAAAARYLTQNSPAQAADFEANYDPDAKRRGGSDKPRAIHVLLDPDRVLTGAELDFARAT